MPVTMIFLRMTNLSSIYGELEHKCNGGYFRVKYLFNTIFINALQCFSDGEKASKRLLGDVTLNAF